MMVPRLLAICTALLVTSTASAAVKHETIKYKHGDTQCVGYLAYDDSISGKRPGVLVVHEWWGLDDYARKRADMLAEQGYVAFAVDMYGEGKTVKHPQDAGAMAGKVRANIETWRARALAGLEVLKSQPQCDPTKLAAIGYCFGGSTALQLGLAGADLDAIATFHGALPTPTAEEAKAIKAQVLICHGADDSFIPAEVITKFRSALDAAKTDYEFIAYPGAVHSFTVPTADSHNIPGIKYNKAADEASWKSLLALLKEAFAS
ncbi:MAG: dienelactone hydrolase family protein [Planctomycetaceae bacterium]|nr:dienelactone hydrolase family protein [Planctomycetaceae bacterium]